MQSNCCCKPTRQCTCPPPGSYPGSPRLPWQPIPQGTWLYIRYDTADTGARPVPSGETWWLSPDIWITGGDSSGNAVGGQPVVVHVLLSNYGALNAAPVSVQFSFCSPSLGIPPTAPPFATVSTPLVPAKSIAKTEVTAPWIPPSVAGATHACLIITCSCQFMGDVPTVPGNAIADRHTGQKNLTILNVEHGEVVACQMELTNLRPSKATVQLAARASWHTVAPKSAMKILTVPSLDATVRALNSSTSVDQRLQWGRRAALIAESETPTLPPDLSVAQLGACLRVKRVILGRSYHTGALVPDPRRGTDRKSMFTPIGSPIQLNSL
jgi:hypothetical protein